MKCVACGKAFRAGDRAIPVFRFHDTGRYAARPASEPVAYVHLRHLLNADRENGSER